MRTKLPAYFINSARNIETGPLRPFYERLMAQFDEKSRTDKEAEEARIEKERAEEAFACRRCPAKFSSNTKLHQYVQDHHQKKPAGVSLSCYKDVLMFRFVKMFRSLNSNSQFTKPLVSFTFDRRVYSPCSNLNAFLGILDGGAS